MRTFLVVDIYVCDPQVNLHHITYFNPKPLPYPVFPKFLNELSLPHTARFYLRCQQRPCCRAMRADNVKYHILWYPKFPHTNFTWPSNYCKPNSIIIRQQKVTKPVQWSVTFVHTEMLTPTHKII